MSSFIYLSRFNLIKSLLKEINLRTNIIFDINIDNFTKVTNKFTENQILELIYTGLKYSNNKTINDNNIQDIIRYYSNINKKI